MEELDRMSIPYEAIPPSEWKRNAYDSNNSVSIDTLCIFYKCARDLEKIIEEQEGDEKEVEEYIINLLSLILTQKLHLIVYHDRWLYFFNGKYFEPCPSKQELQCILRELCEAAAYLWKRFSVHDKTVKRLLSHVQQNAVKVDYPPDISKYVVFENGVLNLDTLELEDFTPQKFFTSMIHADWLAENKACPEYEKVINTYTNHEMPLNKRINEVLGVCLTNDMVKKLFCFLGVTNSGQDPSAELSDASVQQLSNRYHAAKRPGSPVCAQHGLWKIPLLLHGHGLRTAEYQGDCLSQGHLRR